MAEELAAVITAHWQPMVAVGRMQLLAHPSRRLGMYHTCQVSKITLLFLPPSCSAGNRDNKTHWDLRDFSRPCQGL